MGLLLLLIAGYVAWIARPLSESRTYTAAIIAVFEREPEVKSTRRAS